MLTFATRGSFPKSRLIQFMNSMGLEKNFFLLTIEEVLDSEILIYVEKNERILGIGGIRFLPGTVMKFFKIPIDFVVVLAEFQGQSIGRKIRTEIDKAGQDRFNYFVATMAKDNKKALNLYKKSGFKYLGATNDRIYQLRPSNFSGLIIYCLLKVGFYIIMPIRVLWKKIFSIS